MEYFLSSMLQSLSPGPLLLLLVGCVIGIIFGAIPGLTATMGVALLLPLTFGISPIAGLGLLIGVYYGGVSGGLVSATLLGIPGTPSSIVTTFDAYPLARKGQPVRALGIGITASLIGGIISFLFLVTLSSPIARFAVKMGPAEYFSLYLFAVTLIAVLSKGNMIKGVTAGIMGIAFSLIGYAPIDGTPRFAFDNMYLEVGISTLPFIIGLFAISQIHVEVRRGETKSKLNLKVSGLGMSVKEILENGWNIIRSSLIGVGIGILPGMGSGASNLIAYAQAKQASKHPEEFGKGTPEGIWASESANNASIGGALIPMIALGIPGDSVTAILLGGLMIHGIQPGPLLFKNNPDLVYTVFVQLFLAIVAVFLMQIYGMRLFPRILKIPQKYLFTILIVMTVIGAYSINSRMFDVWIMLFFGFIGFVMMRNNYPIAPMILGFVLGPSIEINLRRALMSANGNAGVLLTHPVSALLLLAAVTVLTVTLYRELRQRKSKLGSGTVAP